MDDAGSARYEPTLLPPCLTTRVLSYSNWDPSTPFLVSFQKFSIWSVIDQDLPFSWYQNILEICVYVNFAPKCQFARSTVFTVQWTRLLHISDLMLSLCFGDNTNNTRNMHHDTCSHKDFCYRWCYYHEQSVLSWSQVHTNVNLAKCKSVCKCKCVCL